MLNRTNLLIVVIAIAGAIGGFFAGGWLRPLPPERIDPNALKIGDNVPAVSRPNLDGAPQALDQWRGKLVVLNFWAAWCGPCREEMPLLDRTQQRLAGKGLQVVGVAVDNPAAIREFLARVPVSYPILIDDPELGKDLAGEFGNSRSVLPYTVLIDRGGRIVARRAGNFSERSLDEWLSPYL